MAHKPKPHREFGQLLTEGITQLALAQRKPLGLAQRELADKLGYSSNAIHVWRRGEHLPGTEVVETLARVFVQSWQSEQKWVNRFLEKGEYGPKQAVVALNDELFAKEESPDVAATALDKEAVKAVPPQLSGAFFLNALRDWGNDFFRLSEASEFPRSSWAGMVIHSMSSVTDRITPRGLLAMCLVFLLGFGTIQLTIPVLHWPLDDIEARQVAYFKYGLATLLIPLLLSFITPPDREGLFSLDTTKQRLTFWMLKFTGALGGFWVFSMFVIGVALICYYLNLPPLAAQIRATLALIPLFFSYISARRTPAGRHKMFDGQLRLHDADRFFLAVFVFIGPLAAFFMYATYGFFSDKKLAPITLIFILMAISLWEYRKENRGAISDPILILIFGVVFPAIIQIGAFLLTLELQPLSPDELPDIAMLSIYYFSWTLLVATLWIRNKPTLTLSGTLGATALVIAASFIVTINRWWGIGFILGVILIWIVGRKWIKKYIWMHSSFWAMNVAIGVSAYVWLSASAPIWVNGGGFLMVSALLLWWAYRISDSQSEGQSKLTEEGETKER